MIKEYFACSVTLPDEEGLESDVIQASVLRNDHVIEMGSMARPS